jgi:hypothetical protein
VLDGLYRPGRRVLTFEHRVRRPLGPLRIAETWEPIGRDLWRATYSYRQRRSGGSPQAIEASFVARAWDPANIQPLFASCGLMIEEIWGDFRRSPFRRESRRLIVTARPRARFVHQSMG